MKNKAPGMSLIVKTITRLTVGLILIYAIYIVLRGHISPGGGFAGGVIVALSFIHLMLAFGKEAVLNKINRTKGVIIAGLGALIFLFVSTLGFLGHHRIFGLSRGFKFSSAGLIPIADIAVALMAGAGLFVIFLALVLLIEEQKEK